ncbi:MAG: DUF2127 domain-containing protein [Enterobacteriaceae bacterium]
MGAVTGTHCFAGLFPRPLLVTLMNKLHLAFLLSLLFKGMLAIVEVISGLLLWLLQGRILTLAADFINSHQASHTMLSTSLGDKICNGLEQAIGEITVQGSTFTLFYLISHGVIKLWLVAGLWRNKLYYYPVAITVFSLFIVYQLYRLSVSYSLLLVLLTVIDLIVIALIWTEYRRVRHSVGFLSPLPRAGEGERKR